MIHEVDAALEALLRDEVLGEAAVTVAFEAPNRPWIQGVRGPTLDAFLYDLRENVQRREVMLEPVYDEEGKLVARRAPARRFDLYYTISVWGADVPFEHHLLTAVAVGLGRFETLPAKYVPEAVRDRGHVFLSIADGPKRMMPGNLGGDLKTQLELVLTLPLPAKVDLPVSTAVSQPLVIGVQGPDQREQVQGRPPPGPPQQRPPAGPPQQRPPAGQAGPARPPGPPPAGVDPAAERARLAQAAAASGGTRPAGAPGAPTSARPPGARPPGAQAPGARPAGAPGARPAGAAPAQPVDPMAMVRQALAQAASAQAALAQAQSVLAAALARPPGAAPSRPAEPATAGPAPTPVRSPAQPPAQPS